MSNNKRGTTPAGRWGHQAVYVSSQQAMYIVGGEVMQPSAKVTNDVLVLPLNSTGPSFTSGPNSALPPHAFAAATLSEGGQSLLVLGGMTSSCGEDALAHTLDLTNSSSTWTHANPSTFARRRGAAAAWVDNGSEDGGVMVVGGVADAYSCSTGTYTYPATDILKLPLGSSSLVSTQNLPTSLTGADLAVSDFAFARNKQGGLYLVGGQSAGGALVSLNTIGTWSASGGWSSQRTTGDVPAGRVGASLVMHPTLDVLVLHGGQVDKTATSTLALLNTTTWEWSQPANLQPPSASAAAYHTAVMTDSGVMITAFGLGTSGTPSSNVYYLDLRDPTGSGWTWKSYWKSDMLTAYTGHSSIPNTNTTSTTSTTLTGDSDAANQSSGNSTKKVTSIAIPTIIACLILLPIIFFCVRRRVRIARKRRMARHFSFSSQEDTGEFTGSLDHYHSPSRRTQTQFPFGRDANEKDGNMFTDMVGALKRMSTRRRSSLTSLSTTDGMREMSERSPVKVARLSEKSMRWEEIDFGLGRLDERAQAQQSYAPDQIRPLNDTSDSVDPFADPKQAALPLIDITDESVEGDHEPGSRVPELHVQPPTMPPTPASTANPDPFNPSAQDGLDWNLLAQEMQSNPSFRSISPTSTLRSHSHPVPAPAQSRSPSPPALPYLRSSGPPPRLPSLEFARMSTGSTVQLVSAQHARPASAYTLPFQQPAPRAVSQPMVARQLAGNIGRRGSAPYSASSSGSTTPTNRRSVDAIPARRSSASHIAMAPSSPRSLGSPGSPHSAKRLSTLSQLRVVNVTENDNDSIETSSGEAL